MAGVTVRGLMEGRPILVFSSYILEGLLKLHLLMFSSFIGRVVYTGLCLVVLRDAWSRLACVHRMAGLVGLCSVVLRDDWPRLACVQ